MVAQLRPGPDFEDFLQRARPARQRHEGVGAVGHHALALVHGLRHVQFGQSAVRQLFAHQRLGDDADGLAASLHHGIGDRAHDAHAGAAVDQSDALARHRAPEFARGFDVNVLAARVRAAINAEVSQIHGYAMGSFARRVQSAVAGRPSTISNRAGRRASGPGAAAQSCPYVWTQAARLVTGRATGPRYTGPAWGAPRRRARHDRSPRMDTPKAQDFSQPFKMDVQAIRAKARRDIESGAVTEGYRADRGTVLKLLNEALATELICVLRYKRHYFMASGLNAEPAAAEFAEHAAQEQEHADRIAERIVQLGGAPDMSPQGLAERSHSEYVEADSLEQMIKENLIAERIAIDSYRQMIDYIGDKDPTTRRMLEEILAVEEEHADDLADLLD